MKKIFYIANWKMNKTMSECCDFFEEFLSLYQSAENKEIVFCPSFTTLFCLDNINGLKDSSNIFFGAQNVSDQVDGPYTGEISVGMLNDTRSQYCIVGHSERRSIYKESDEMINNKIKLLIDSEIIPILCVGESWEERKDNKGNQIVLNQLSSCLKGVQKNKIIIAYEPIWAIGTGKNANIDDISDMNSIIKNQMNKLGYIDEEFYILYGGSVNIDNVKALRGAKYIDGFLIGGASLKADSFFKLIKR